MFSNRWFLGAAVYDSTMNHLLSRSDFLLALVGGVAAAACSGSTDNGSGDGDGASGGGANGDADLGSGGNDDGTGGTGTGSAPGGDGGDGSGGAQDAGGGTGGAADGPSPRDEGEQCAVEENAVWVVSGFSDWFAEGHFLSISRAQVEAAAEAGVTGTTFFSQGGDHVHEVKIYPGSAQALLDGLDAGIEARGGPMQTPEHSHHLTVRLCVS